MCKERGVSPGRATSKQNTHGCYCQPWQEHSPSEQRNLSFCLLGEKKGPNASSSLVIHFEVVTNCRIRKDIAPSGPAASGMAPTMSFLPTLKSEADSGNRKKEELNINICSYWLGVNELTTWDLLYPSEYSLLKRTRNKITEKAEKYVLCLDWIILPGKAGRRVWRQWLFAYIWRITVLTLE